MPSKKKGSDLSSNKIKNIFGTVNKYKNMYSKYKYLENSNITFLFQFIYFLNFLSKCARLTYIYEVSSVVIHTSVSFFDSAPCCLLFIN